MASLVLRPADDGISPVGTIFVPASFITKQNANTIGKTKDFIELFFDAKIGFYRVLFKACGRIGIIVFTCGTLFVRVVYGCANFLY